MSPEITLLYVHSESIGYGRLGVQLAEALTADGVDVYDHQEPPPHVVLSQEDRRVSEGRRSKDTSHICWVSVPTHARGWYENQHASIFTMWEATYLPEAFRDRLYSFETVLVPSPQNVELFGEYHPNVKQVLLGIDPARWHYRERKPPETYFDFLIGGSGPRKGCDLAFKAFQMVFGPDGSWPADGPIPRLIMKNPKTEPYAGERVLVYGGRLTAADEVELYARSHVYLQPSRGEGFGLQPLQAIAQGMPTVLTDAHGHASYAHLGWGLPWKFEKASYFIYGDAHDWWEPDLATLCELIEHLYYDYEAACERAKESAAVVASDWTWANTARQFVDALGGRDALSVPFTERGCWHEPDALLFPVTVTRDYRCEVGGTPYLFRKGVTYYETADVKRILFEADRRLLDPSCLTGDHGLTAEQAARLGDYSAAHSYCGECGQRLGSGVTRSDEIYAELEAAAHGSNAR